MDDDRIQSSAKAESSIVEGSKSSSCSPRPENPRTWLNTLHTLLAVLLLFLNFFLAQYDKFVLSYFQTSVITSLNLTSNQYGILSGYATGIAYALLAIPIAFIADYTSSRVWVLSVATLWWSICVIFQGLSHNFWQILLARIAMGIGQAPAEALSVSLISDFMGRKGVFIAESVLYVGVYVGEAVSAQIATAFLKTNTPWNTALKAIGIVGVVVGVLLRIVLREPARRPGITQNIVDDGGEVKIAQPWGATSLGSRAIIAKKQLSVAFNHIIRMRSLWLLTLSSGARQFSGNVFGYYMPSYLASIYPSKSNILSNYGIIVGAVGSVAVLLGGFISSYSSKKTLATPLYITGIGGMVSSIFVILMVVSRDIAPDNNESKGTTILYGVMSAAYLTAELWLGAFASLLAFLLPPHMKTFGLAMYSCIIVLIYSSAPQIIGLALRSYEVGSDAYIQKTKVILAVLIPVGYWVGGVGFLLAIPMVRRDIAGDIVLPGAMSGARKLWFWGFSILLGAVVISLFVTSIVNPS